MCTARSVLLPALRLSAAALLRVGQLDQAFCGGAPLAARRLCENKALPNCFGRSHLCGLVSLLRPRRIAELSGRSDAIAQRK
eukprot:6194042-Pleurochrysis_carterae.AAC.1